VPAQPVDATPSAINLFSKGGVYDATETGEAFREPTDRDVAALEGGAVVDEPSARISTGAGFFHSCSRHQLRPSVDVEEAHHCRNDNRAQHDSEQPKSRDTPEHTNKNQ